MAVFAALFAVALTLGAGCQSGSTETAGRGGEQTAPQGTRSEILAADESAYARDLDRICHAQKRSGALESPAGERTFTVARWLAKSIESQAGRDFLAQFQRSTTEEKVALLQRETARLGLASCPLAATWAAQVSPAP